MEGRIIQAVDIGTTKVAAIVARQTSNGKLEILGLGKSPSFGVTKAEVLNVSRTIDAIKSAVAEAEKQSGITFNNVYVGIAGSHINSLQHRATLMREDYKTLISQFDIDKLKEDTYRLPLPPGDEIIDILPQDYKVDNITNVQDPIGMVGNKIEVNMHVVTGSTTSVNNIKRCIEGANLKVLKIFMQPIASAAAVLSREEKQSGVALVDIGGGTTDIAIFVDETIAHTAVIPFGGESITHDIEQGCRILKSTAEGIKVQHGSTFLLDEHENLIISIPGVGGRNPKEISMKNLVGIIQARMEEILDYVNHEISSSALGEKLNCGIVFTGGGSHIKHLRQLSEYHTGHDVKIGLPNEHLVKSKIQDVDNPIYSTVIGLIIKGLEVQEFEHQEDKKVDKPVDNHKIVEKTEEAKSVDSISLSNAVENEKTTPEDKKATSANDKNKEEKPKKSKDFFGLLKTAGKKVGEWINDDNLQDFNDINNKK
ncbi:MAG: cell division protein FtsA [Chitinophagales bacterium]|nr:cell division protein FtsA [Chitinophagales bacterium]